MVVCASHTEVGSLTIRQYLRSAVRVPRTAEPGGACDAEAEAGERHPVAVPGEPELGAMVGRAGVEGAVAGTLQAETSMRPKAIALSLKRPFYC
jgi:hypothetical protein